MKVVIAPDKFKGSCPADAVARALARGWHSVRPGDELVLLPVADGGEGTLEAFAAACGGELIDAAVHGPMGERRTAQWLRLHDGTAVIEMARASGLNLVEPAGRNVRRADTFGTGELLKAALDAGCRRAIVGIGGSATCDGGMGLLRALSARFLAGAEELTLPGDLMRLTHADFSAFDGRLTQCEVVLASDVANPLCGPQGASVIFGPQKGASPEDVAHMDGCLARLAAVVAGQGGDMSSAPGAGAAGGLGWALMQCCGAAMRPGIDVVLEAAGFARAIEGASLILTGEGSLDDQTALGKVPVGVAARAEGLPVAAIAGRLGPGHEAVFAQGVSCALAIADGPMTLEQAMAGAEPLIEAAAARLARILETGRKMGV